MVWAQNQHTITSAAFDWIKQFSQSEWADLTKLEDLDGSRDVIN